jgi:hypothetical protein
VHTATSYFDPVWNAFSKHTDGSMQWIPKQIVAIGEEGLCHEFEQIIEDECIHTVFEHSMEKLETSTVEIHVLPE